MNKEKPILVYSANGVQGGAVVRQAVRQGYKVRALVRNPEKSGRLKELGVEIVAIDLQQGAQLRDAHRGIEYVVLQMPLGVPSQMEPLVSNAIEAIQANGVKGVVVKTGSGKPAFASDVPAFALNQLIEDKLRDAGSRLRWCGRRCIWRIS
jgi:NAD(P)H dehydrogenase (quinone)